MTGQQLYQRIHTDFRREEPIFLKALLGHSSKNLDTSTFSHRKIVKGYASLLYRIGFSRQEDSIKIWRTWAKRSRKKYKQKIRVLLARVAIGSTKPFLYFKNHHDRFFVIDLKAAPNSLEFYQTATGSVLSYDTVPSEFLTKIINLEDGSERFGKEENEEEESSPTKKGRRDLG